ncbi:hypothetical protein SHELI_v1c03880 [Spiroplasma helicoides]|uniref:Uncharacterized protein n=1 Tax=Spiroplasma helicoides TaxID=216938 RepID=A0A1B3SK88_9MOLU|nr:DUF296 domain-containing protein [Spiroplasma helicoides]AOG60341.1 hypothetical protein SHELI_v1c03880 [Spiroplasma helicoides]
MEVREKGQYLMLYFDKGEEIVEGITNATREYTIIDGRISGTGHINRLEYGVLTNADPIFFTKSLVEKLLTVTSFFGKIENREISLMINSVDQEYVIHMGKVFRATAEVETIIFLEVLKTD